MERKSLFNIEMYVNEMSGKYLILRLKNLEQEELEEKPYKTMPIIHSNDIKKYVIYADKDTFQTADKRIGNAFIKLFSRKTNEQIRARETIVNYYRNKALGNNKKEFQELLESMQIEEEDLQKSSGSGHGIISDEYSFEEAL